MNNPNNKLLTMSLDELWQLFPIDLVPHQESWSLQFLNEKEKILNFLNHDDIFQISHIGSSAIKGIMAKPIVDIMIELNENVELVKVKEVFEANNYLCMSASEKRIVLNKGYTVDGFAKEVFHIHLRYKNDNDEIYFRDYLNENEAIAKEYEKLKIDLANKYRNNRDLYTELKSDFVNKYTKIAKTR